MYVENSRRVFFEQRHAETIVLDSVAEFFDVECKCEQEKLCFGFAFSSCQKTSEPEVLLDHAEGALDLNRSVHPQQNTLFGRDAFLRFLVLLL